MWTYTYTEELYHHGIKGMKWGVRRFQNEDGSLTPRGVKRYAKKGYEDDEFNKHTTTSGKILTSITGQYKARANDKYLTSSKKKNRERAEQYLKDKEEAKNAPTKDKVIKTVTNGARATTGVLASIGAAYAYDQLVNGGMGTEIAKSTIKTVGRLAISTVVYATGGRNIRWYDN